MISTYIGFPNLFFIIFPIIFVLFGIWIWALIDCILSKKESDEKLLWFLIIIFLNIIGAILYFIFSYKKEHSSLSKQISQRTKGKRVYRSKTNEVIGGVCGGIADYFSIDPIFIRLIFVFLFLFKGSGLLLYIILWIIIPIEPEVITSKKKTSKEQIKKKKRSKVSGILLLFLFLFLLTIAGCSLFMNTFSVVTKELAEQDIHFKIRLPTDDQFVNQIITSDTKQVNSESSSLFDYQTNFASQRIQYDYNYIAHNGSNLQFKGVQESTLCDDLALCYELLYQFDVQSDSLPEDVTSFDVRVLFSNKELITIAFIEQS